MITVLLGKKAERGIDFRRNLLQIDSEQIVDPNNDGVIGMATSDNRAAATPCKKEQYLGSDNGWGNN